MHWFYSHINNTHRLRTKLQKVQAKLLDLTPELKLFCHEHQRLTMAIISHEYFKGLKVSTDLEASHYKAGSYIRNIVLLEQRVDNLLRVVLDVKNPDAVIKHGSDITEVFSLINNAEQNDWKTIRTSLVESNKHYTAIVQNFTVTDNVELKQHQATVAGSRSQPALRFSRPQGYKPTQGKGYPGAGPAKGKPAHGKKK